MTSRNQNVDLFLKFRGVFKIKVCLQISFCVTWQTHIDFWSFCSFLLYSLKSWTNEDYAAENMFILHNVSSCVPKSGHVKPGVLQFWFQVVKRWVLLLFKKKCKLFLIIFTSSTVRPKIPPAAAALWDAARGVWPSFGIFKSSHSNPSSDSTIILGWI